MMGWPFLHPDFLRWTVDMYFQKKKKNRIWMGMGVSALNRVGPGVTLGTGVLRA